MLSPADQFSSIQTQEKFAASVGVSLRTVEGWVIRGYLPTVKLGKHRLVNIAALVSQSNLESLQKVSASFETETVFHGTLQATPRRRGRPKKSSQIARQ